MRSTVIVPWLEAAVIVLFATQARAARPTPDAELEA